MDNKSSITSLMSAFGRAFHAEHETNPVFNDYLAKKLMTEEEYNAVKTYILGGAKFFEPETDIGGNETEIIARIINYHIAPSPLCRAAYAEKSLKTAELSGTSQYVILGAGLDTFAFRSADFVKKHRVFEVDHPLTQKDKLARINKAGWQIPENLKFVSVDFINDSLAEKLLENGFSKDKKAFFSWLGVAYYLSEEAIGKTLGEIAEICAKGSTIVFDYPDENFFTATERRVQNTVMMAKAGGEPMKTSFSYEKLEKTLENYGFLIYELLTPQDIQRDIIDKSGSLISAFEHVNYCLAVSQK